MPIRGDLEPDILAEIRDLHTPDGWHQCRGCDSDGYEAEAPAWPCRTARLVYTETEIAEAKTVYENAMLRRRANPQPPLVPSWVSDVYREHLVAALSPPMFTRHRG